VAVVAAAERDAGTRIIRARRYAVKPMSVDEAALEVTDGRDAFIVFRNATTDTINVLFRRPDGNLGLIEPEA
jgi:putative sigma-54 modulation protein